MALTEWELRVLRVYVELTKEDPRGAWWPYHDAVTQAAGGGVELAYGMCKALKARGLLACNGRQSRRLISAPSYWATERGLALIESHGAARSA